MTTGKPEKRMSIFEPTPALWTSRMLSIFRIVAGLVFVTAGTTILFGFPPSPVPMPSIPPMSQLWIGGVLEMVGGLFITVGFLTRPVAFLLAGEMAVAYFQFHVPQSFFPTTNMGVPAVLYCFFYLYLVFAGGGVWSVDAEIARKRQTVDGRR
jgi:putative oxidoreductase